MRSPKRHCNHNIKRHIILNSNRALHHSSQLWALLVHETLSSNSLRFWQIFEWIFILMTSNTIIHAYEYMKSSDAKASKCHLKFSTRMIIFIKLVYLSSVISLKWQWEWPINCYLSEITELKYTSLIKIIIKEENFKWLLEVFASELFIYKLGLIHLFWIINFLTENWIHLYLSHVKLFPHLVHIWVSSKWNTLSPSWEVQHFSLSLSLSSSVLLPP